MKYPLLLTIGFAITLASGTTAAAGDKKAKKEHSAHEKSAPALPYEASGNEDSRVISQSERQIIESHLHEHYVTQSGKRKKLPPGLAKKVARGKDLPPGWQKKIARGETMPEEVYKVARPLPKEILVKLPPPPAGTIMVAIEGKIARVLEKTRQILDVFEIPLP